MKATVRGEPTIRGERIDLRSLARSDRDDLLAVTRRSRALHRPWVRPPTTRSAFDRWMRDDGAARERYAVREREGGVLVAYVALNQIVLHSLQSAYLGYWVGAQHAGLGYTREAVAALVSHVFRRRRDRLHRVEANIQPENGASIALVKALGFRREGFSQRYLRIEGRWRDHERWALTREDWPG